jgi:hypothetical protein
LGGKTPDIQRDQINQARTVMRSIMIPLPLVPIGRRPQRRTDISYDSKCEFRAGGKHRNELKPVLLTIS